MLLNRIRRRFGSDRAAGTGPEGVDEEAGFAFDGNSHENGRGDSAPAGGGAPTPDSEAGRSCIDLGVIDVTEHPLHHAFGHGKLHGQWRIDDAPYQEYLLRKAREEALAAEVRRCDAEIEEGRRTRTEAAELRGSAAAKEVEIRHARAAVEEKQGRVQEVKKRIAVTRERLAGLHGRGSVGYGLLYGLTGVVFIVGDVALARYTVARALRMNGWEGWAFAVGLALLAIVLKPLYDRLVEDRFHEGHRRAFVGVILVAALGVGLLLAVLGTYRADFMRLTVQDGDLGDRITKVETDIRQLRQTEQLEGIPRLEGQRAELEAERSVIKTQIAQNEAGKWTLILAQLLFAVAGAICLGIAFRHWIDWYHLRWPVRQQLGAVRRERKRRRRGALFGQLDADEEAHEKAREAVQRLEGELEMLRARIAALEPEEDVQARIEQARQRREGVLAELERVRGELFSFLYRTGHAVGWKLPEQEARGDGVPTASEPISSGSASPPRRRQRRMYLALRAAVRRAALQPDADS